MTRYLKSTYSKAPKDAGVRAASIVRVVDADTVVLNISLGDGFSAVSRHVRLVDVHSPERFTVEGKRQTTILRKLIAENGSAAVIELRGADKYGRACGVIWSGDTNLNEEMAKLPQGGR